MPEQARSGDWVEILEVVLGPGERAPQVPDDTKRVPLEMRLKGFIMDDAKVGERAVVRTVTGRRVEGRLVRVNPRHTHDFGEVIPELLTIGAEIRRLLSAGGEGS